MPLNGSGSASAAVGGSYPASGNTTIESGKFNTLIADFLTMISTMIAKDGQTTTTSSIPFASGIAVDTIAEKTSATGVTIDGLLIKDGGITGSLAVTGTSYIGDTSNANATLGLTINQAAATNEILAFKNSNVTHGITALTETDSYAVFTPVDGGGGLVVHGLSEGTRGLQLWSSATTNDATKSTVGLAGVEISARLKTGTGVTVLDANNNILAVRSGTTTRFILDADGDSHQDVGTAWTNFDAFDDVALLDALSVAVSKPGDPIKQQFGEFLQYNRDALERAKLVTFNEDGHHFVNMSKLTMALTGAVRQVGHALAQATDRLSTMESRMLALESKA